MGEQLTRQEGLFGEREAHHGSAVVANSRLFPWVKIVTSVVDEARAHIEDGRLRMKAVDAANVGMVEATVETEMQTDDGGTVGVDLDALYRAIQNKPRGGGGDAEIHMDFGLPYVTVRVDQEIHGVEWEMHERVGTLDPDMVREEPELPDLTFDAEVELPVGAFTTWIHSRPGGEAIEFDASDGEFQIAEIADDYPYTGAARADIGSGEGSALYAQDYLKDIFAGLNAAGVEDVTVEWSDSYPLQMSFEADGIEGTFLQAPRVRS